jgi:clan AA aspartic protease (TIGR02281 family)
MKFVCIFTLLFVCSNLTSQVITMEKIGRTYRLPCTVNGLPLNFILDTGADEVSISLSEALFMLKNDYIDENDLLNTEYYQLANGEVVEGTKIVLRTLKIGGLTIKNVEASIVHTMNAPLLLGQSALSKLGKITIDYAKNQLIINEKQEVNATLKNSALDFLLLGNDYYKNSDYSQAIIHYTKSIEVKSDNPNVYYNRGLAKFNLAKYSSAIEDFSIAILQNPNYSNAYLERANSKKKLGEIKQAIEDYSMVIMLDSSNYESYYKRAGCYLDLQLYEEAIKDYNNSLLINKKDVYSFINRSLAKFFVKKYTESLDDCERAISYSNDLDSVNKSTMYNIKGLNLFYLDKYSEAINSFNLSISFDNKNSKPVYNRGRAYYFSEKLSLACNDWVYARKLGYSDANFLLEKYCEEKYAEIIGTADSYYNLSESFADSRNKKIYKTIQIGTQTWMAENLNVATFRNGDTIPEVKTPLDWELAFKNNQPAWCYYENDIEKGNKYGKLYNWFAVNDTRGLAPEGWHVSTDDDWLSLEQHLGSYPGKKMKSSFGWRYFNNGINANGTNSSGFSGLPGGCRFNDGYFHNIESDIDFWCISIDNSNDVFLRKLHSGDTLGKSNCSKGRGLYVRCVKN